MLTQIMTGLKDGNSETVRRKYSPEHCNRGTKLGKTAIRLTAGIQAVSSLTTPPEE